MRRLIRNLAVMLAVAALIPPTMAWAGQVVSGTATTNLSFQESVTTGVLATQNIPLPITQTISYTNGTGAKAVDTIFGKQVALVASTPQTFDLSNLVDPAGNTVNFARVRVFAVQVVTTTANFNCNVYKGASNGWSLLPASTGPITVPANGGIFVIQDPNSTGGGSGYVTGGTSKTFTLDPGANAVTVNLIVVGGSSAFVLVLPFGLRRRYGRGRKAARPR